MLEALHTCSIQYIVKKILDVCKYCAQNCLFHLSVETAKQNQTANHKAQLALFNRTSQISYMLPINSIKRTVFLTYVYDLKGFF